MKQKLMPDKQEYGYVGFTQSKGMDRIYYFHEPDGNGGTLVVTKTEDNMESRYEKLIQPFRLFKKEEAHRA